MSKRIQRLSELKAGQRAVSLKPTILGTIEIEYLQRQKDPSAFGGGYHYVKVEKPASPRPDVVKRVSFVVLGKKNAKDSRPLSEQWLIDGLLVSDGPCRRCSGVGLMRDKITGEHKSCKECFGGWL